MKKILPVIILGVLAVTLAIPVFAQEENPRDCCTLKTDVQYGGTTYAAGAVIGSEDPTNSWCASHVTVHTDDWGAICMFGVIGTVVRWVFRFVMFVAVIFFCVAAFYFMTASGSPEKLTKAKSTLIYALIGTAVALLAWSIPRLIQTIFEG